MTIILRSTLNRNGQAWLDIGRTDAADWNADKVKKMTFKSYVFLQGDIKILDATEDLKFDIGMQ